LTDEEKDVFLIAPLDPQHAFGAKDMVRQLLEKALEPSGCKGPIGSK
jgi:hypothetical protein